MFGYFLRDPIYLLAAESKSDNCVTMLVLGSYGWLLWSCVVELLCLDTNKKVCVDVDLPLVILVFLEAPQIPTCGRI